MWVKNKSVYRSTLKENPWLLKVDGFLIQVCIPYSTMTFIEKTKSQQYEIFVKQDVNEGFFDVTFRVKNKVSLSLSSEIKYSS